MLPDGFAGGIATSLKTGLTVHSAELCKANESNFDKLDECLERDIPLLYAFILVKKNIYRHIEFK